MNYVWGSLMFLIGLFFHLSAIKKSEFIVYRMFVARSKMLWKENVHKFYMVVGVILMAVSMLFFFNIW